MNAHTPIPRKSILADLAQSSLDSFQQGKVADVIERTRKRAVNAGARQTVEMIALRDAIDVALANDAASMGGLFGTVEGYRIVNAMHDLTECDALYDMAKDVAHDAGIDPDTFQ